MENYFVPYVLALKMKALGFDEPCLYSYYQDGTVGSQATLLNYNDSDTLCSRPTFSQAFKWFRVKGFLISLSSHEKDIHDFYFKWSPNKSILSDTYDTYEEAELACLERLIEIIEEHEKGINI